MNELNKELRLPSSNNQEENQSKAQYAAAVRARALENQVYTQILGDYEKFQQLKTQIAQNSDLVRIEDELKNASLTSARRRQLEEQRVEETRKVEERALFATLTAHQNMYKHASAAQKAQLTEATKDRIAQTRLAVEAEFDAQIEIETSEERRHQLEQERSQAVRQLRKEEAKVAQQAIKLQMADSTKAFNQAKESLQKLKEQPTFKGAVQLALDLSATSVSDLKELQKATKDNLAAQRAETKNRIEYLEQLEQSGLGDGDPTYDEAKKSVIDSKMAENMATMQEAIVNAVDSLRNSLMGSFKEAEDNMVQYMGPINARLQGTGKTYSGFLGIGGIAGKVSSVLSISPFIKTQAMLENIKKASEEGIAYNIEQRAFLATLSDKIATTFDAFEGNLLRLIRLQQADSTAARLGMEAALTRSLNSMFNDSSYLNGMYDAVSSALIDASSVMTHQAAAEFEFVVQKWLGALSSLGLSESTVQQIATGINYLATGDVTSLASNTQLQTLMAMSASYANLSYSDMLVNGINAATTNKLLESMVTYLKKIAEDSGNQVVRSAYGDVFNLSMSDMRAISNITSSEIATIAANNLSYGGMNTELMKQMVEVAVNRTTLTEVMSNLYNNAVYGVAQDLVSNPGTYAMVKMLQFMEEQDLDINIPFINAMGFGLDLNATVGDLLNMGLGISSAFSLITNILSGLGGLGGMNLNIWGGTEYNQRGGNMSFVTSSLNGGVSGSTFISNNSSSDMEKSSITSATEDSEETKEITNKNNKSEFTFDDFFKAVIQGSEGNNWLRVEEKRIKEVYGDTSSNFLHVRDSRMKFSDSSLKVYDTRQAYDASYLTVKDIPLLETVEALLGKESLTANGKVNVYDKDVESAVNSVVDSAKWASYVDSGVSDAISNSFKFAGDALKVSDSGMSGAFSTLSQTLTSKSVTTIAPSKDFVTDTSMRVFITNADAIKAQNTVNLAAGTTITIDKATLVAAFREAMGYSDNVGPKQQSLQELLSSVIQNGELNVKGTVTANSTLTDVEGSAQRFFESVLED